MLRSGATKVPSEWAKPSGEVRHIQMDRLLAKLRKNVVELILQGDDVTRQMWRMYAIFGEVFGQYRDTGKCISAPTAKAAPSHDSSEKPQEGRPATAFLLPDTRIGHTATSRPRERSPHPPPKSSARGRSYSYQRRQKGSSSSSTGCNPLLDTIGSLTPDPGDSDDSDLEGAYRQLRLRRSQPKPSIPPPPPPPPPNPVFSLPPPPPHSDRESVSYAGSNSVDSGYKSLCATPEVGDGFGLPDVTFRSGSSTASGDDTAATDSSAGPTQRRRRERTCFRVSPSRIKMGTSAIRKPHRDSRGECVPLADVTLDHLMYLRQSLLSHVQTGGANGGEDEGCSSDASRCQGDGIIVETEQRVFSVRNVTLCTSMRPPCDAESGRRVSGQRTERANDSDEDAERLLFSEAEYYDLESIEEFPCCYVTSADGRQRNARRKSTIVTDGPQRDAEEQTAPYRSKPGPPPPASRSSAEHRDDRRLETSAQLTEAALCVLKMIEEFRLEAEVEKCDKPLPQGGPRFVGMAANTSNGGARQSSRQPWVRGKTAPSRLGASRRPQYGCTTDYHVYEEIVYDTVVDGRMARPNAPPPLPERPGERRHRRVPPKVPPPRLEGAHFSSRSSLHSALSDMAGGRSWVQTRDRIPTQRVDFGFTADYSAS